MSNSNKFDDTIIRPGVTLRKVIENHSHWLHQDCEGWENMRADLSGHVLANLNLKHINLAYANLDNIYLNNVDLTECILNNVNLNNAEIRNCYFKNTILTQAKLQNAILTNNDFINSLLDECNLSEINIIDSRIICCNLSSVDLVESILIDDTFERCNFDLANLKNSYIKLSNLYNNNFYGSFLKDAEIKNSRLNGSNLIETRFDEVQINLKEYRKGKVLTEDIIGYKQCLNHVIVTLKIPRGAIVFSVNGQKCRTNKAEVIAIDGANRAYSRYNRMSYYVGDKFNIYNFNCEYNQECSEGIHFFMTREEAEAFLK